MVKAAAFHCPKYRGKVNGDKSSDYTLPARQDTVKATLLKPKKLMEMNISGRILS